MTVVAFIIFPTRTNNFNVESLRGQAIAKQLRETISAVQKDIGQRLFEVCLRYTLLAMTVVVIGENEILQAFVQSISV